MLTRREFLASTAAGLVARRGAPFSSPRALRVDAGRLRAHLEALSVFGRPAGGSFADGISRVGYSEADRDARAYLAGLMREADLEVRVDAAANLVGRRAGTDPTALPLLFGSHVDSVPGGGNFDGPLGTLAAIEVARVLAEQRVTTRHPLEAVVWTNEEGVAYGNGLDGSRAAAGELVPGELDQIWNGIRKADAIRSLGGNPGRIAEARRAPASIHGYLELHIEQGGILAKAGVPIGVVQGIVGIDRFQAVVRGVANHAGTTPMPDRHDALLAAAKLVQSVNDIVVREPGRQVGTVGKLDVSPNAPNVVPGTVTMTIELRDLSAGTIARLASAVRASAAQIAAATGTRIDITPTSHHEAAPADDRVQQVIADAAGRLGLPVQALPSGAGHDAQMMARVGPMGMIFVPSIGGISHSPAERTGWDDCVRGADVLLQCVLAMDGWTVP
jgi:N-carbamoyl-L-amino-acid hydrolase